MKRTPSPLAPRLAAALFAAGALALLSPPAADAARIVEEPMSDDAATLPVDLELPLRDGETLRFADLVGRRVLIVTWASW